MDTQPNGDANAAPVPEKKKTLFDIVLTSTPVILTVVATFMVGRSTAEMTQAQYHRLPWPGKISPRPAISGVFFQAKTHSRHHLRDERRHAHRQGRTRVAQPGISDRVRERARCQSWRRHGRKESHGCNRQLDQLPGPRIQGRQVSYKAEQISKAFETIKILHRSETPHAAERSGKRA